MSRTTDPAATLPSGGTTEHGGSVKNDGTGQSAISVRGLTRTFESIRAVDSLDLNVRRGEVYGFLGPNGAGKTTTIRLLLGLLAPDTGDIVVMGHDVRTDADAARAVCGALLEHDGLYERLSVAANLDLAGRLWQIDSHLRAARTRELLEKIDLWDRRGDQVRDWSRGMKRKLAVARALYHKPELVFLDEPTSGLDPVAAAELVEDLREMVIQEGTTVFLTTHNLSEAEKLCDRIGVLRDGRLVVEGTPDEIRALAGGRRVEIIGTSLGGSLHEEVRRIAGVRSSEATPGGLRVTLDDGYPVAPIVTFLVNHGAQIEEVRKGSASLEEAFLALVSGEGDDDAT